MNISSDTCPAELVSMGLPGRPQRICQQGEKNAPYKDDPVDIATERNRRFCGGRASGQLQGGGERTRSVALGGQSSDPGARGGTRRRTLQEDQSRREAVSRCCQV